jgi:acyl-lipid omega-6 desaturase (Delta-12 desaturase)
VIWTNLALAAIGTLLWITIGWKAILLVEVPILFLACSSGVWLFYVQHNFDGTYWQRRDKWDFLRAGLHGSSFYKLPKLIQWFTGNIGFHHIHHLGPKIPNYKLPQAHKENRSFRSSRLRSRSVSNRSRIACGMRRTKSWSVSGQ